MSQQRNNRKLILVIVITLLIALGLYFIMYTRQVATEQARVLQEERDSKKIENKIFGHSVTGRPIDGYEIGNGPNTILLISSLHGDEIGTVDLLNKFINEVKIDPSKISKTKKLIVIPIANPDGYYDRVDKLNANLVNLNLNFETSDWQEYGPEGTYAGPKPFSEPESQIIKKIVEDYKPSMMISYHAMGTLVSPEHGEASTALGKWYTEKTGYEYYLEWDFPGTATKWFTENTGKPAITVELTTYRADDWEINKGALLELIYSDVMPL